MIILKKSLILLGIGLLGSIEAGSGCSCCAGVEAVRQEHANTYEVDGAQQVVEPRVNNPLGRQPVRVQKINALPCFPRSDPYRYGMLREILMEDNPLVVASWYSMGCLCKLSRWALDNSDLSLFEDASIKYAWRSAMNHLYNSVRHQRVTLANKDNNKQRAITISQCDAFLIEWRKKMDQADPKVARLSSPGVSKNRAPSSSQRDLDQLSSVPSWVKK